MWAHLSGDAQRSLGKVPWVGRLPLSSCPPVLEGRETLLSWGATLSPQSHGTKAGFKEEYHLLQGVIDGGMCLVNISAMNVPGKSSFYVKIHYKQEGGKRKVSFPSTKRIELFLTINKF